MRKLSSMNFCRVLSLSCVRRCVAGVIFARRSRGNYFRLQGPLNAGRHWCGNDAGAVLEMVSLSFVRRTYKRAVCGLLGDLSFLVKSKKS